MICYLCSTAVIYMIGIPKIHCIIQPDFISQLIIIQHRNIFLRSDFCSLIETHLFLF